MHAIKTVITAAGNLKREQKDLEEDQICLRALKNINVPQFLKDDLKLFNSEFTFISRILNNAHAYICLYIFSSLIICLIFFS